MTIKKYGLIILCILCLVLVSAIWASATQGPSIARRAIGSGENLEQGIYSVHNTLGQPVVGRYGQSGTSLCVGYWCNNTGLYSVYVPFVVRNDGG